MIPGSAQQKALFWLHPVLSVVTPSCISLLASAVVYTLVRPRNPDSVLAIHLISLELLLGLVASRVLLRNSGPRQQVEPRLDT